jgi:Protein of unknown function (DUF2924)
MKLHVAAEVAALRQLSVAQLRTRFAALFGEPTRTSNKVWLVRRLAWRLQALAEGDLSERARRRAAELAQNADLRHLPPRSAATANPRAVSPSRRTDPRIPCVGTILSRRYKGRMLNVRVVDRGFGFDGQVFPSLSAVARAITGSHCNGFLFFGLVKRRVET